MSGINTGFSTLDSQGGLDTKKTYLLIGDKESGKEEFLYKLTSAALSNKMYAVYITTGRAYTEILNEFSSRGINISQYLGNSFKILDDFSRTVSPKTVDNNYTKILNGPLDLTGLSVSLSAINNDLLKDGRLVVNIFDSLSPLLLYNNPVTVFRFLQFVCGRAKMSGVTTVFSLDDKMHSPETTETIKSLSDAVVSLKLDSGKRYFTLSGLANEKLQWTELK